MDLSTEMGPGSLCGLECEASVAVPVPVLERISTDGVGGVKSIWTCILHLTSSIGVLRKSFVLGLPSERRVSERREFGEDVQEETCDSSCTPSSKRKLSQSQLFRS